MTTNQHIPLSQLDRWLSATFSEGEGPIKVRGGLSRERDFLFDVILLRDIAANTVRISLPSSVPSELKGDKDEGQNAWTGIWAPVLVASGVVPPLVDPVRLLDLSHRQRRIRFFCDTNALAGGVLQWLQLVLDDSADVVTSAVVDREIAAWPEQKATKDGFWSAKGLKGWKLRTAYRLARRFLEMPPAGIVVDRLSPEQGALVLAKFRDESEGKSPDADVLLVELARSLVQDQPRNARVLFLSGDRNGARTATGALGPENVLFAVTDDKKTRTAISEGATLARGWWVPGAGLGAVHQKPTSQLLWSLMAACDILELSSTVTGATFRFEVATSFDNGVPSDWADPWLKVSEIAPPATLAEPDTASSDRPGFNTESAPLSGASDATRPVDVSTWLLPPQESQKVIEEASPSWRPNPTIFFVELLRLFEFLQEQDAVEERYKEVRRILMALNATDGEGRPGPRLAAFREAWETEDYDWFHAEFLSLPGYKAALDLLTGEAVKLGERQRDQVNMARALGQVAALERGDVPKRGDRPLSESSLRDALGRWLPEPGATLAVAELADRALTELEVTPHRFERAMILLWQRDPRLPFEGRTGGTVEEGFTEKVISMGKPRVEYIKIGPHQLRFGRTSPVRFITRTQ